MEEEADPQVRAGLAQEARDELQVVVVHPDRRATGGHGGRRLGEPLVDADIRVPPLLLEGRCPDGVVVERPERVVGEPVVELRHVLGAQYDGDERDVVVAERLRVVVGQSRPTDPDPAPATDDAEHGPHEAPGARFPGRIAADVMDRQPVGHDDQIVASACRFAHDGIPTGRAPPGSCTNG